MRGTWAGIYRAVYRAGREGIGTGDRGPGGRDGEDKGGTGHRTGNGRAGSREAGRSVRSYVNWWVGMGGLSSLSFFFIGVVSCPLSGVPQHKHAPAPEKLYSLN
jgi:hypothetical protein